MRALPNMLVSFAVLFLCNSASADTKSIQGTVIGADGKPLFGAEVQAQLVDTKSAPALTKTNAKGQYAFKGLPAGTYSVTAFVKGVPRSRAAVTTRANRWAEVDFDLRLAVNNKTASKPTTNSSDALQRNDLSRIQQSLGGNINNMSFPGH